MIVWMLPCQSWIIGASPSHMLVSQRPPFLSYRGDKHRQSYLPSLPHYVFPTLPFCLIVFSFSPFNLFLFQYILSFSTCRLASSSNVSRYNPLPVSLTFPPSVSYLLPTYTNVSFPLYPHSELTSFSQYKLLCFARKQTNMTFSRTKYNSNEGKWECEVMCLYLSHMICVFVEWHLYIFVTHILIPPSLETGLLLITQNNINHIDATPIKIIRYMF